MTPISFSCEETLHLAPEDIARTATGASAPINWGCLHLAYCQGRGPSSAHPGA